MLLNEEERYRIDRYCFVLQMGQEVRIAVLEDYDYYLLETMDFIDDPEGICPSGRDERLAWLTLPDRRRLVIPELNRPGIAGGSNL